MRAMDFIKWTWIHFLLLFYSVSLCSKLSLISSKGFGIGSGSSTWMIPLMLRISNPKSRFVQVELAISLWIRVSGFKDKLFNPVDSPIATVTDWWSKPMFVLDRRDIGSLVSGIILWMGSYKLDIGFTGVEGAGIVALLEPDGCRISGLDNCGTGMVYVEINCW